MAMRAIIRVGDRTSHGGTVIEGFSTYKVYGIPAAGLGHRVECPKCQGVFPIVESAPNIKVHGVGLALEGMRTACGAILIASQNNAQAGLAGGQGASMARRHGTGTASQATTRDPGYGMSFLLTDSETGRPLAHRKFIANVGGVPREGITDGSGYADVDAQPGQMVRFHMIFQAPARPLNHEGA